jgi:predicted metallo-beta-lactamase superfamily hydrolase
MYFYSLQSGNQIFTNKMILIKWQGTIIHQSQRNNN